MPVAPPVPPVLCSPRVIVFPSILLAAILIAVPSFTAPIATVEPLTVGVAVTVIVSAPYPTLTLYCVTDGENEGASSYDPVLSPLRVRV